MNISDFITPTINTIEGLPRSGRGYLVTDIKYEIDAVPVIEVEMNPDAFRTAIGYLNHVPFGTWSSPTSKKKKPTIEKVIYNPPATIVWFSDGDKIVSKVDGEDEYSWETGLAICVLKKRMDRKEYNRLQPYFFAEDPNKLKKVIIDGEEKEIPTPLWETLVRMYCPNGEWEKIKKEWRQK